MKNKELKYVDIPKDYFENVEVIECYHRINDATRNHIIIKPKDIDMLSFLDVWNFFNNDFLSEYQLFIKHFDNHKKQFVLGIEETSILYKEFLKQD